MWLSAGAHGSFCFVGEQLFSKCHYNFQKIRSLSSNSRLYELHMQSIDPLEMPNTSALSLISLSLFFVLSFPFYFFLSPSLSLSASLSFTSSLSLVLPISHSLSLSLSLSPPDAKTRLLQWSYVVVSESFLDYFSATLTTQLNFENSLMILSKCFHSNP